MKHKKLLFFTLILCVLHMYGQERKRITATFGTLTPYDRSFTIYEDDSEAAAVILFEKGYNTFEVVNNFVRLIKTVHKKIKVIDASRFEYGSVTIPYYKSKSSQEKIAGIKAITHNNKTKTFVGEKGIFNVDLSEHWSEKRFTFSDIRDGSILEYTYRIESPYFFNFNGWDFQGNMPKVYSEFSADIPGNYVYRRSLIGNKKLDISETTVKKYCFSVPGTTQDADCDSAVYAMFDVPAYTDEPYMLAESNYKSRVSYELQEITNFEGVRTRYSRDWKDVDKEFRSEKDIGQQLKHTKFFKDRLPAEILNIDNEEERAKAVYHFIKDHFVWDNNYRVFSEVRVKKAFEEKKGNIAEINIALINALRAANLEAFLTLSSTRENGLPATVYPVLTDFNYVMAFVKLGDKEILLDATNRLMPYGLLPFRALNSKARIMDFKKGSYWIDIIPNHRNVNFIKLELEVEDQETLKGTVERINSGYRAYDRRKVILGEKNGKLSSESERNTTYDIYDVVRTGMLSVDEPVREEAIVEASLDIQGEAAYFKPFFLNKTFEKNPFNEEKRQYPIDFGYPINDTYLIKVDLKDIFEIKELPQNKKYSLPNNSGQFVVSYTYKEGILECQFNLQIKGFRFGAEDYPMLKDFFSYLVVQKVNTSIKLIAKN